jgi:hypothetical protein
MRHYIVHEISDNISEEYVASIYRTTSILKMEAADSSCLPNLTASHPRRPLS